MTKKRADFMSAQIMQIGSSYRRSIDAKSSESTRDKNNTSSTLIDKINRNKVEKYYNVKGEGKKTFWQGLVGKDAESEREED